MLSTNSWAILRNYQNALMHISKPRANLTLINYVNKVYELKLGSLGPIG